MHILTIEDPVEYVHTHKMSAVSQREVGLDSPSFDRALRSALREDPDVLLIGEMRDIESIQIALTMAETGHLVFATLHTNDAPQAIDRIIDVFPAWRQEQTRVQLAASLAAVVAQRLVPRIGGGMVAAFEVLVATNPVRNLIREGRSNQLQNVMMTNPKEGMRTLETSLADLIAAGTITYEDALAVSAHPKELVRALDQPRLGRRYGLTPSCPIEADRRSLLRRRRGHPLPRRLAGRVGEAARRHVRPRGPTCPRQVRGGLRGAAAVRRDRAQRADRLPRRPRGGPACATGTRAELLGRRAMTVRNAPMRETVETGLVPPGRAPRRGEPGAAAAVRRGRGRDAAVPPAHRL